MNCLSRLSMVMGVMAFLGVATFAATVPPLLNYQGVLRDAGGSPLTGNYSLTFRVYDAETNGQILWTETQSSTVSEGLFNVLLGSISALPDILFLDDQRWLGITVGADPELQPRRRIVTAAFAYHALDSDSAAFAAAVGVNSVNSQSIQDFTIDGDDIKGGTITGDKIAGNAIISSKISDGSIVGVDIAASQITTSHVVNGTLIGADIADGSINGAKIADGSLAAADHLPNSLTGNEIQDASIQTADLADASITSLKILDGTVNSGDIGTNAVGASEILADAISAPKISDEPGVAQALNSSASGIDLGGDSLTVNLLSRSINCPASGYVLAIAFCNVNFDGDVWPQQPELAISDASETMPAQVTSTPYQISTFEGRVPVSIQRIFSVTAGSHTFYFVGRIRGYWWVILNLYDLMLSLVYVPSAYGTVSGATPNAPPTGGEAIEDRVD